MKMVMTFHIYSSDHDNRHGSVSGHDNGQNVPWKFG